MKKKKTKILDIILPSKKINYFIITILVLGVISGSIFLVMLSETDKTTTINQIKTFFDNVSNNSINNGLALKNSLIINYIFIIVVWILGLSIIGILFNIFLVYIKGFILGFSISSIVATYSYKAIPASILYIFPAQILNIIVICTLGIYSIMFTKNLLTIIISKKPNNRLMLKKYTIILIFSIIISFISSLSEVYLFPNLLKLIVYLYK